MEVEIRPATPDDYPGILRADGLAFGEHYDEQDFADAFADAFTDPADYLVATAAGQIVGVTGAYTFEEMTVPGGSLPVRGVSWVSVSPTHRRRGILRALMDRQLRDFAAEGMAAAVLTASEAGIYGRFGYGPATTRSHTVIDRRAARLLRPDAGDPRGQVELLTPEQARQVLPELHRRWRRQVPGALSRTEAWWDYLFADRQQNRDGRSGRFYLVHSEGYLSYRVKRDWNGGFPRHQCWIVDYAPGTEAAHAALWGVLFGMDLFGTIESDVIPPDDPLPFLLTDFRQVHTVSAVDGMWLRPVDPAALLAARRYRVELDTVLEVGDPLLGDRRLALAGGPDGASCRPTDQAARVSFSLAGLGSAYLGGHRLTTLARAGLVRCDDPALLERLELAFATDRAPAHGTPF